MKLKKRVYSMINVGEPEIVFTDTNSYKHKLITDAASIQCLKQCDKCPFYLIKQKISIGEKSTKCFADVALYFKRSNFHIMLERMGL